MRTADGCRRRDKKNDDDGDVACSWRRLDSRSADTGYVERIGRFLPAVECDTCITVTVTGCGSYISGDRGLIAEEISLFPGVRVCRFRQVGFLVRRK